MKPSEQEEPLSELPPEFIEQANLLCSTKQFADLVELCAALDSEFNNNPIRNNLLGIAHAGLGAYEKAISYYKTAIQLDPEFHQAVCNLGVAFRSSGQLQRAINCYKRAIQIQSDYASAHSNLGNALRAGGRLKEAIESYRRAVNLQPESASAHFNLGVALHEAGLLDAAIESYLQSLQLTPDNAEANNNLGVAWKNTGRAEQALVHFRRAIATAPNFGQAYRHLSATKKFSHGDEDLKLIERAYERSSADDRNRMQLAFGLSKAYEDIGDFESAFRLFTEANSLRRAELNYSSESTTQIFERLSELFSGEFLSQANNSGITDSTPIFIVGMPRSGTTLVEQILASHSQVFGAGELPYLEQLCISQFGKSGSQQFVENIKNAGSVDYQRLGNNYLALLRSAGETSDYITDKMPLNFMLLGIISLAIPGAKIIHCCRHPIDTCLSIYKNYFHTNANQYAYDLVELGQFYNLYQNLMQHWHKVLPQTIYDIRYEELVSEQEQQTRLLLNHCDLDWEEACMDFYRTDRAVQTVSASQVRQPMYSDSVEKWKRFEEQLEPLVNVLNLE